MAKAKAKADSKADTKEKRSSAPAEKSSVRRAPSFFKVYATNTLATSTRDDFRVEIFNERFQTTAEGWIYQSEGSLILTRAAAKRLSIDLARAVREYEAKHGELSAADELGKMRYID